MRPIKRKDVVLAKTTMDKSSHEKKWMKCKSCINELLVDSQVVSVRCASCVIRMLGAPEPAKENKSDRPKGWRFMSQFVDADGTVYFHGEEQPDLKGTLPITDVNKIKSEQKKKRDENKKRKDLREKLREKRLVEQYEKSRKEKKDSANSTTEFNKMIANELKNESTIQTPITGGLIKNQKKEKTVISKTVKRKKTTTKKSSSNTTVKKSDTVKKTPTKKGKVTRSKKQVKKTSK